MLQQRVLLVAQSPVLRVGIQGVLEADGRFRVVAEAQNGLEAASLTGAHNPSLAIIQDALAGVTGVMVAQTVRDLCLRAKIIVLTDSVDEQRIVAAVVHGVDALLPSAIDGRELVESACQLISGDRPLDQLVLGRPDLAARVFDEVREAALAAGAPATNRTQVRPSALSGREIAILDGVVRGLSNREIAGRLFVVEQTVKNHMTSLLRKLSAGDRTEAVVSAVRTGMIDLGAQLPSPAAGTLSLSSAA